MLGSRRPGFWGPECTTLFVVFVLDYMYVLDIRHFPDRGSEIRGGVPIRALKMLKKEDTSAVGVERCHWESPGDIATVEITSSSLDMVGFQDAMRQ